MNDPEDLTPNQLLFGIYREIRWLRGLLIAAVSLQVVGAVVWLLIVLAAGDDPEAGRLR